MAQKLISTKTMRSVQLFARVMTFGGLIIVALGVLYLAVNPVKPSMTMLRVQVAIIFVGLALNQVGVLKLAERVFTTRRFLALRKETEGFLSLVSALNERAVDGDEGGMDAVVDDMHQAIEKLRATAGIEALGESPAAEPSPRSETAEDAV